jgi:hypothetical protein
VWDLRDARDFVPIKSIFENDFPSKEEICIKVTLISMPVTIIDLWLIFKIDNISK